MTHSATLRAGDWIEIRSKEEILATLDKNGRLNELPFMPEMFDSCGKRFQVQKRAHKTCDPPNGLAGRRMLNTVHLDEIRCNGAAHGGCEARCLVFWKEAWLKPVDGGNQRAVGTAPAAGSCAEADVIANTRNCEDPGTDADPTYVCQSTRVAQASFPLQWWDFPSSTVEDYTSGNVRLSAFLISFFSFVYAEVAAAGIGVGSAMRWVYSVTRRVRRGGAYPHRAGTIPKGVKTPSSMLNLQPGELVKVKRYDEILPTLNEINHNRGMYFDAEMVGFCESTTRVLARVTRLINEKTGKMLEMKNDCILLEGVVCQACHATNRRFCPRAIYPYWREIWLERVESGSKERQTATTG